MPNSPSQWQQVLDCLNDLMARFDAFEERCAVNDAIEDLEEEREERENSDYMTSGGAPLAAPADYFADGEHGGPPEKIHED